MNPSDNQSAVVLLAIIILFSFTVFYSLFLSKNLAIGVPPDETAHISKIRHVKQHFPELSPLQEKLCTDTGRATNNPNYLAHPPVYYLLAGLLTEKSDCSAIQDYMKFRLLSVIVTTLALVVIVLALSRLALLNSAFVIYLLFIISIPIFPYLAASPNNDNLALLFFSLLILSWILIYKSCSDSLPYILLAFSLALCLLTKATTGLQTGIFSFIMLMLLPKQVRSSVLTINRTKIVFILILSIPVIYYLYAKYQYGTFLPSATSLAEYYWKRVPATKNPIEYASHFFDTLNHSFTGISSGDRVYKSKVIHYYGLFLVLIIPITQVFKPPQQREMRILWSFYISGIATTIIFIAIHLIFVYGKYRAYGYLGGIQFRYYIPLVILVAMGYMLWHERTTKTKQLVMSIFVVPSLIWGNMFYFLDQRKTIHQPKPASESVTYISYHNNAVILKGKWKSCSNDEIPKLLVEYRNETFATHTKQGKQKNYVLSLKVPMTCKQYLNKLKDTNTILYCSDKEQRKQTLINETHCN
jgi:hypothetical protein